MGPRLFSRGKKCRGHQSNARRRRLQWGRGCSAAERATGQVGHRHPVISFNGAAAVQPRKGVCLQINIRIVEASMGPRLFSRGKEARAAGAASPAAALQWGRGCSAAERVGADCIGADKLKLQWGRGCSAAESFPPGPPWGPRRTGFNGAAAVQPRKGALPANGGRGAPMLQWGRGCSAAEREGGLLNGAAYPSFNGAAAVQPRKEHFAKNSLICCMASMGPRLFSRGKNRGRTMRECLNWASMGPRLFSRGKRCRSLKPNPIILRGFNGAAAVQPRKVHPRRQQVNISPSFNGAAAVQPRKDKARWSHPQDFVCFNGAAAVQPRKVEVRKPANVGGNRLQWGRGCSAAESIPRCIVCDAPELASMGPRLFSRGKPAAGIPVTEMVPTLQWGRGCSAAERPGTGCMAELREASMGPRLFSRGKVPRVPVLLVEHHRLQWGRGCSAAESKRLDVLPVGGRGASMGPRLFSRGKAEPLRHVHRVVMLQWGRGCSAAERRRGWRGFPS